MPRIRKTDDAKTHLTEGRVIVETRQPAGTTFGLDNGLTVPTNIAKQLQGDLFVVPAEDGLFPGHSQTFHMQEPTTRRKP